MTHAKTHENWQNTWQAYGFAKPVSAETVAKRHALRHGKATLVHYNGAQTTWTFAEGVLSRRTTKPAMLDAQPSIATSAVAQHNEP